MRVRHSLRRVHIWLGWLVGVPFLLWTLSGLVMAWKPIEEVRGTALVADTPALPNGVVPVPPAIGPRAVKSVELVGDAAGPRWLVRYADGPARRADARTGALLPPLTAAEAMATVRARFTGDAKPVSVTRTSADDPPLDLRRPLATWRVGMDDGTALYVAADSGEIVARRTRWWRIYDFMWGIHIMDLETRENTSNGFLFAFAILSTATALLALILLPLSSRRKRSR
ncbi:hypothetical protein [Allosphingosinicella indica]|uniref:PepSY domain-containing protein n=1 Tax=Allosphingosinicella indica TaxID=941907 RepID=A0A1X7G2P0_9SPHN|nr:hypothetical protein [Allosphingosinicella indica]SMF62874.1 hypothetical protein SAMN06295910_1027 [Allosphingosinicella indica]